MNYLKTFCFVYFLSLFFNINNGYSQCIIHDVDSEKSTDFISVDDDGPSAYYSNYLSIDDNIYFSAGDGVSGIELWKIDGKTNETLLVKDLLPGRASSNPANFVELNSTLFFIASAELVTGLWKSDGTEEGTVLIKTISEGESSYGPSQIEVNNGILYFSARKSPSTLNLWRSDGTESGTFIINDTNSYQLTACGSDTYFTSFNSSTDWELWQTDGTEAGTSYLYDIGQRKISACFDDEIYFTRTDGLWRTDETTGGIILLDAGVTQLYSSVTLGDKLIFTGYGAEHGSGLWVSDGTNLNMLELNDSNGDVTNLYSNNLVVFKSKVYFTGFNNGSVLWESDGTASGTKLVERITQNNTFHPSQFIVYGDYFYFSANDGISGDELWRSDGTAGGTISITDIGPGNYSSYPIKITGAGDHIYFNADDGVHGYEMWSYNIHDMSVQLVEDINAFKDGHSITKTQCDGDELFYQVSIYGGTNSIWSTSSASTGSTPVVQENLGDLELMKSLLGKIGSNYYFIGDDGDNDNELWISDGTAAGTKMVKDIYQGQSSSEIENSTIIGDKIYFNANDGIHGSEPWVSDGTAAGTFMLADINSAGSYSEYVGIGSQVFFTEGEAYGTRRLWVTDGTADGTAYFQQTGFIRNLTAFGSKLLFSQADGVHGNEPWISDGTIEGTKMLKDILPGPYGSFIQSIAVADNIAFIAVRPANNTYQLWKTDGTTEGTELVKDLTSNPNSLLISGNRLFFIENNARRELWTSDGTTNGTYAVTNFQNPDDGISSLTSVSSQSSAYFVVRDYSTYTSEIWFSDGTIEGTYLAKAIDPCLPGYSVNKLAVCNDELYYVGPSPNAYQALYKLNCSPSDCATIRSTIWNGPKIDDWHKTPVYWEGNRIPTACDDVIIPAGYEVTVQPGKPAVCRTLDVKAGAVFNTLINAELSVNN